MIPVVPGEPEPVVELLRVALGLLAALIVVPFGQPSIAWFSSIAFLAIVILWRIGAWYKPQIGIKKSAVVERHPDQPDSRRVRIALLVLVALLFSKQLYVSSLSSYYIFYLMHPCGLAEHKAQLALFVFLAGMAVGTMIGGPVADRIGRKAVIWGSILGTLPFSLALPHVGLPATVVLSGVIGVILSSAFPSIVVYGQELLPGRVGTVSGLFFGLAFGIGGLGGAPFGGVAGVEGDKGGAGRGMTPPFSRTVNTVLVRNKRFSRQHGKICV